MSGLYFPKNDLSAALSFGFALFIWARSFLISICISFLIGAASAIVASPDSMSSRMAISAARTSSTVLSFLFFELPNFSG
jgi:hypothetical protein